MQRHEVSMCFWKNGAYRLAWYGVDTIFQLAFCELQDRKAQSNKVYLYFNLRLANGKVVIAILADYIQVDNCSQCGNFSCWPGNPRALELFSGQNFGQPLSIRWGQKLNAIPDMMDRGPEILSYLFLYFCVTFKKSIKCLKIKLDRVFVWR